MNIAALYSNRSKSESVGRRYTLLEEIGVGNMGKVYRALDRLTGTTVALKQVKVPADQLSYGSQAPGEDMQVTLAQEFKILASLRHPNIISVLDYGFDAPKVQSASGNREPYVTMELLENADNFLDTAFGESREGQIQLLLQMLQALFYLHRRNVLHRDLKPKNILVVAGQVKVLDFGLSILSDQARVGEIAGTPSYMAPEIWMGNPASRQSDLYAVGIIMYRLFAGRHPFDTSDLRKLRQETLNRSPDLNALQASDEIKAVIGRLLEKDIRVRTEDAAEVIAVLRRAIGKPGSAETAATRESFLQAATFVGRENEMDTLANALAKALAGEGSACLIGGESGVGKSRLLDELRTRALVQGALVLRGQATSESGAPFDLWRNVIRWLILLAEPDARQASILKPLIPDIGELLGYKVNDPPEVPSANAQMRVLEVIEFMMRAATTGERSQSILMILEDVHWADSESIVLLRRLIALAPKLPLLIIGAYRDDETPDLPVQLPGAAMIKLSRLNAEQTGELAVAMLGNAGANTELLRFLQEQTEGNTFFLVELVRALAEEAGQLADIGSKALPMNIFTGGIKMIIHRRLARVSESGHTLLQIAAVAGRDLNLDVTREVLKGEEKPFNLDEWLTECADAAVLEVQDGVWRFSHNKLREGVLEAIPPTAFKTFSRRVAVAIEQVFQLSPKQPVERLMYHWRNAGESAKEGHYAALAGEQALRSGAYKAAQTYLKRAIELQSFGEPNPHREANMYLQWGDASLELSELDAARAQYMRSYELHTASNSGWGMASALSKMGSAAIEANDFDEARRLLHQALETAHDRKARAIELSILVSMAYLFARTGHSEAGLELVSMALNYPNIGEQTHFFAERLLQFLQSELPEPLARAAAARGSKLEMRVVVERLLAKGSPDVSSPTA